MGIDALDEAIQSARKLTKEEREEEEARAEEAREAERFRRECREQEERDRRSWARWERIHGPPPEDPEEHRKWVAAKLQEDVRKYQKERDEWIRRIVGDRPRPKKQKKRKKKEEAPEPERASLYEQLTFDGVAGERSG